MRLPGGTVSASTHWKLQKVFGNTPGRKRCHLIRTSVAPGPTSSARIDDDQSDFQMSSLKQIVANRRNALKSTGPTTPEGKQHARCNAVRHGLTAETVIGVLEDANDYAAFEAAVTADYDAESAVERELVLRLASVLWRLRRATGIETALFDSVIKQSGQSDGFARTNADLLLARLFLDPKDQPSDTDAVRKR